MVVTAVTLMMTTMTTMKPRSDRGCKPRSDRGCSGGEWQAAATAVAVATRGCFDNKIRHPR